MVVIDWMSNVRSPDTELIAATKYILDLQIRLQWTSKLAIVTNRKEMQRHERNYGKKVRCSQLSKDDIVLVKKKISRESTRFRIGWRVNHMW